MNNTKLKEILNQAIEDLKNAENLDALNEIRNKYFAKKSELANIMSALGDVSSEIKKSVGQELNFVRAEINQRLEEKMNAFKKAMLEQKLLSEKIDISLPGYNYEMGSKNPFHVVLDEMEDIFIGMGFEIGEGPEIELDKYNFELLNIPSDHPARDMQDTFYINDKVLLRTHTSPVQARTMEKKMGKPIRIICPGKTYRRDDDDATHSHQFAQIEGLVIDKDINIGHLKATLELFAKKMFGDKREIRLRPSYFPFTEPSVEVDISCYNCGGKGCPICKGTGYIELLGGGMVHPNVLKMSGYDPDVYSGFAFGIGIDRLAMLRYGIDDIRKLYQNDVRLLHQFKKKI